MKVTADHRPDPQALLSAIKRERHGALKIFLGAFPGVGKTYKMLEAAREARREGADIVIGIIESHGRQETESLCEGLESIPLMPVAYRGAQFRELNLDAILKRAPAVVLIDELAHRNIPGTRHPRRYQDIDELLEHDIDVWTTVNIQHLESLNDVVARITGVRMRETVPDTLLGEARDLVLVDLTPRELIERLKQGKVYIPEQARAALDGFFSPTNLSALRELTLQTVAERIDRDVREVMRTQGIAGPWPVRARIVVAVDGVGNGDELVRLGRRLAERRRAPWSVVFVERGDIGPEQQAGVERTFELAARLGGEPVTLRGHDPVEELIAFARDHNATTLVVGRSRHRPWAGWFGSTLSQRLLRQAEEFEITFVASRSARVRRRRRWLRRLEPARDYVLLLAVVAAATGMAAVIEPLVPLPSLSLVFLTAVLLVAVRTAMRPALITAVLSAAAYNFFFTEPRYTFAMHHTHELVTVGFFLIMGLIGGQLAGRLRHQVLALRGTNEQTQRLLSLSRRLAAAVDLATVHREATLAIAEHLHVPVVLLAPSDGGQLAQAASSQDELALNDKAWSAAQWAFDHRQPSGFQTQTLSAIDWRFLPLAIDQDCFGVLGVHQPSQGFQSEQLAAIDALTTQVTMAMARTRLATTLEQAKVAEETERLRSALLSSVSHDLRTPLASMIGAASSLRSLDEALSTKDRQELLDSVISEGERLNRYIQNLLDMTRLGHGTLKLERDWIGIDDILNSALRRTRELLSPCRLVRNIEPGLPLLYVHPALIEQALVNVIENAAKFSPDGGEVRVAATREGAELLITVADEGPGIPPDQREQVFNMFFTGGEGDRGKHGSGLGLAICSGMIGAHGGRIEALPGPGGRGTSIAIHLPLIEPPVGEQAE
ncbi:sensor histidine kinase [Halochromatium roseum]|uniref:sensor histidine kinase n=1 Tax=Halochromatium roseum TaxID=391920 RepID=UPI0019117CC5|nr:sensor histidine kinase KdpD [Halochromatium roseum]MBK5942236.1 two-component sensor histidine kinase [Halochromatium roseum]